MKREWSGRIPPSPSVGHGRFYPLRGIGRCIALWIVSNRSTADVPAQPTTASNEDVRATLTILAQKYDGLFKEVASDLSGKIVPLGGMPPYFGDASIPNLLPDGFMLADGHIEWIPEADARWVPSHLRAKPDPKNHPDAIGFVLPNMTNGLILAATRPSLDVGDIWDKGGVQSPEVVVKGTDFTMPSMLDGNKVWPLADSDTFSTYDKTVGQGQTYADPMFRDIFFVHMFSDQASYDQRKFVRAHGFLNEVFKSPKGNLIPGQNQFPGITSTLDAS